MLVKYNPYSECNEACTYDEDEDYQELWWKGYLQNEQLIKEYVDIINEKESVLKKIISLKKVTTATDSCTSSIEEDKKKNRKRASEILKVYQCPFANCFKRYGSDTSLNLHLRIKHKSGGIIERERQIVLTSTERHSNRHH